MLAPEFCADGGDGIGQKLGEELLIEKAQRRDGYTEGEQAQLGRADAVLHPIRLPSRLVTGGWSQCGRKESKHGQPELLAYVGGGFEHPFGNASVGRDEDAHREGQQAAPKNGRAKRAVASAGLLLAKRCQLIGDRLIGTCLELAPPSLILSIKRHTTFLLSRRHAALELAISLAGLRIVDKWRLSNGWLNLAGDRCIGGRAVLRWTCKLLADVVVQLRFSRVVIRKCRRRRGTGVFVLSGGGFQIFRAGLHCVACGALGQCPAKLKSVQRRGGGDHGSQEDRKRHAEQGIAPPPKKSRAPG